MNASSDSSDAADASDAAAAAVAGGVAANSTIEIDGETAPGSGRLAAHGVIANLRYASDKKGLIVALSSTG